MTAAPKDDSAILSCIEAKVSSMLQAGEEQTLLLSRLSALLDDRLGLENALSDAVRLTVEISEKLNAALETASQLTEEHERDRAELIAQHLEAAAGRERAFELARESVETLEAELNRTKRKYRAAQWDAERERKAHQSTQAALAAAEEKVRNFEESAVLRASVSLAASMEKVWSFTRLSGTSRRRRRKEQMQTIVQSGLFDSQWYLATYPDVAAAGADPLSHFFDLGWREGRDPSSHFATSAYLKANADVARSGINPLIHYVEFGRSEGREIRAHRASAETPQAIKFDFPDPAPVYEGTRAEQAPVLWVQSYRLLPDDPRLLSIGAANIGYVEDQSHREQIERAFDRLASLSGAQQHIRRGSNRDLDMGWARLLDAWYINHLQLRMRWNVEGGPFVVRAFQHDFLAAGQLKLVGERLISSELDFIDLTLCNPYFPLLFVFAEPMGRLQGTRLMAFPSLCRGGLHYPELVSSCTDSPDPLEAGLADAARLQEVRNSRNRLVQSIQLDLSGADGTSPLFQPDFRAWLERVMQVRVCELGAGGNKQTGPSLILASDMVPTIRILTERKGKSESSDLSIFIPLLIAGTEPSQPAMLVEMPPNAPDVLASHIDGFPAAWPRLSANRPLKLPGALDPTAIRLPRARDLGDAELAVPVASGDLAIPDEISPVTWMIVPEDWKPGELVQSLHALALQAGAETHSIAFVGDPDTDVSSAAKNLFSGRVNTYRDASRLAKDAETPLIGHIGPGVILHDTRSAAILTQLLSDPAISSATCPLVAAERRGKGWQISVVDAGSVPVRSQMSGPQVEQRVNWQVLWRSTFPVSRPPRDFWIARSASVQDWLKPRPPSPLKRGMHICNSAITASYLGARSEDATEIRVPGAMEDSVLTAKVLFG